MKIMKKKFLQVFLLLTISFVVNAQQRVPGFPQIADIGTYLGECRGKFIVYTGIYIELGQKDTVDSLKYLQQLTDSLSRRYVADSRYYDQISAQEIKRFAPIARRDNPKGAQAELNQCIKFVGEVKKMN
jgi:hypothetical protein